MHDRPLVYVAGPYTLPDPVTNVREAIDWAEDLLRLGVVPVVPHLTMLWHLVAPHDLAHWYAYDLAILARCDALFRIPGPSVGADLEVTFAREHGLRVFTEGATEVVMWAQAWRAA